MLPIALRPDGRRAVIVGGGNVALRKAETLLAAGLQLHVVAPIIDLRLRTLLEHVGGTYVERAYEHADLTDAQVVIAATSDLAVNARVVADARAARVLSCDATQPDRGDFTMLATARIGDLTFAVDSGRSSPAFSRRIVREIAERFGPRYDAAARTLARMRTYVRAIVPEEQRADVLRALAQLPIDDLGKMNAMDAEHEVESTIARLRSQAAPPRTQSVVCASRASALAMTQTRMVAARLAEYGMATTILNITTTGDRVQDRPLAQIGTVNVFVKELELALRDGRADYAVHSCKDLPGVLESDMRIAAISRREDPRDAFCSERYPSFDALPAGAVVGTSSLRRRAQLQHLRPDLRYEDIRGNVDTRLRKLRDGAYDAIVLAMAGLNRLQMQATHTLAFGVNDLVPAVAQGALAIETRLADGELATRLREALNDERTEIAVVCERAALRALRAGCNAPLGIHARIDGDELVVDGSYAVLDQNTMVRETLRAPLDSLEQAEVLGETLAARLAAQVAAARPRLVVLARTQERPSRIAQALRNAGVDVLELREGERGPDPDERPPDMLLFPSSGSVAAARVYLERLAHRQTRPLVAAMGPRSGDAAREAGFPPDIISPDASIDTFVALVQEQFVQR